MAKQKSYLYKNLCRLRKLARLTQQQAASKLDIGRSKLNNYENKLSSNPHIEDLLKFSAFYSISVDDLLKIDLSKLSDAQIEELKKQSKPQRLLAYTVDRDNKENIELIDKKAVAGYLKGYLNEEYIRGLRKFYLPFLPEKTYRAFQLSGDSMFPIPEGAYILTEYVDEFKNIKNGSPCIVITKEDIVFKLVYDVKELKEHLLLVSLNKNVAPYTIEKDNILQIWKMVYYFTNEMPGN